MRREGHVSTSRPPKSHVVDHHPFAEPPEGHTPTALCEISPRSYCTTNAVIANDQPHHPELGSIYSTYPVIANLSSLPPRHPDERIYVVEGLDPETSSGSRLQKMPLRYPEGHFPVEMGGVEPPSKQRTQQLSTRLFFLWFSSAACRKTG